MKILRNKILFKFVQDVVDGKFKANTNWGFELKTHTDDAKYARWGEVIHTGQEVKDIVTGDYILVEPLMWTPHIELDNRKVWGTITDKVIAVSKKKPEGLI